MVAPIPSPHRLGVTGYRRIGFDLVIGFLAEYGNSGDGHGPRAVLHPTLTYKTPQCEGLQPYNGIVVEED